MRIPRPAVFLLSSLLTAAAAGAQTRDVKKIYGDFCANCHGASFEGGSAPSLAAGVWKHGGDEASVTRSIRDGYPQAGMPPWNAILSGAETHALVVYIHEQVVARERQHLTFAHPADNLTAQSELYAYRLETVIPGLQEPWSIAFLPDGRTLVTEKKGTLRLVENGRLQEKPVADVPAVDTGGQAGLFDVVLHPDFAHNGWIYLAFADPKKSAEGRNVAMTKIIRGHLRDGALVDQQTIFQAPLETYRPAGGIHFGGRITFDRQGHVFFSIGERGTKENAQDLTRPNGKIHRLQDDGRVPADNPFVNTPGADPSIWSYGHRNPQGLVYDAATNELWETEHGPRGGDELNLIRKGLNYGWPVATEGIDYDLKPITYMEPSGQRTPAVTTKDGMEPAVIDWTPSIAVSSANIYTGDLFPKWKGNLFAASLAAQELRRLELKDGKVVHQEIIFKGIGRLRDAITGPDGSLYVLLPDRVSRMIPADAK
ncbi:MAG: PQQ-dependent sugar dehydrogenase [Verrucomicrobia bacterium]|nr:PQQ-dependent sugar dehydrogenase [Verrucomicrobiota bacterium]